jgi:hypothetical protein
LNVGGETGHENGVRRKENEKMVMMDDGER